MSATNHTANYELSQYIGSDEPKYLTDYNGDMSKIDTAIKGVDTKAETANTGVATNASAISALDTAVGSLQTQVTTVAGVANGNTGSINTINSLIGSGEPTTSDKTIIGSINEIYADITGGGTDIDADNIDYDNTTSGLTATNVQDAIDEIASGGAVVASAVGYTNTSSGLSATDVQDAIDEVNGKFGGSQIRYDSTSQAMQYSADGGTTWANFKSALSIDEVESADTAATAYTETLTYTFEHDHDEVLLIGTGVFRCMNGSVSGATLTSYDIVLTPSTTGSGTFTNYHHTKHLLDTDLSLGNEHIFTGRDTFHIEDVKAGDVFTLVFTATATNTAGGLQSPAIDCEYTIFTVD